MRMRKRTPGSAVGGVADGEKRLLRFAALLVSSLILLSSCASDHGAPGSASESASGSESDTAEPFSETSSESSSPDASGSSGISGTPLDTSDVPDEGSTEAPDVTDSATAQDTSAAVPTETGGKESTPPQDGTTASVHKHSYVCAEQTPATCLEGGVNVYICACGASYSEYTEPLPHDFAGATCTSAAVCKNCGTAKEGSYPLGHDMTGDTCRRCGMKTIELGVDADTLRSTFGTPTRVYTEKTSQGEVESWVYDSDKTSVRIFQLCGGKVCGAFVCGAPVSFLCSNHIIMSEDMAAARSSDKSSFGELGFVGGCALSNDVMDVYVYRDTAGNGDVVASWGRLNTFDYGLETISGMRNCGGASVSDYSVQEKLCLEIVNCFRAMNGAGALAYSDGAAEAALIHSIDMAENEYFEHEDANGVKAGGRLDACGITDWMGCGENIFAGYENVRGHITGSGLVAAYEWYVSPDHRHVMLSDAYSFSGVGIAKKNGSKYRYYYTQVFYYK